MLSSVSRCLDTPVKHSHSFLIYYMKHLEGRQKCSAARRIFNSLLGVSSGDETLHLMFDILLEKLSRVVIATISLAKIG